MDSRNCSPNRDQVSTSPLKGSIFIGGSFTERETKPVGADAVCFVGPLMSNRAVETDRLLSIRRLAFWIAFSSCEYILHKCLYLLRILCRAKDREKHRPVK